MKGNWPIVWALIGLSFAIVLGSACMADEIRKAADQIHTGLDVTVHEGRSRR